MSNWVRKLGVVGGGAMGKGIALQSAISGIETVIKDINSEVAENSRGNAIAQLGGLFGKGVVNEEQVESVMRLLQATGSVQDLKDCNLVIEAVPEKRELKEQVFRELDRAIPENVMFASNTSTIPINELAESVSSTRAFVGLHFFNPVPLMKLVEVIPHLAMHEIRDAELAVRQMNRVPILVKDRPGFLINRCLLPFILEGFHILQEWDVSFEDIDKTARDSGYWPMGPFKLLDLVGIDVAYDAVSVIVESHPDGLEMPELFTRMYTEGRWGNKAGSGFYKSREGEKPIRDLIKENHREGTSTVLNMAAGPMDAYARMQAQFLREAVLAVQDDVAKREDIDKACKLALNVSRGPLAEIDEIGKGLLLRTFEQFESQFGPRFAPPARLKMLVKYDVPYVG